MSSYNEESGIIGEIITGFQKKKTEKAQQQTEVLSRTTIYRWRKTNPEFKEKLDNALEYGRENVNDMAEAMLIQKIQERDMGATKFWRTCCFFC
jgi:SOS-response transcriptional repressor LexA